MKQKEEEEEEEVQDSRGYDMSEKPRIQILKPIFYNKHKYIKRGKEFIFHFIYFHNNSNKI